MKIKMLTCLPGINYVYNIGDEVEVENNEAKRLIAAGFAEEVSKRKEIKIENTAVKKTRKWRAK